MKFPRSTSGISRLAIAVALAAAVSGCAAQRPELASLSEGENAQLSESEWRQRVDALGARYRERPDDPRLVIAYARALRASGQRAQAAAVLQQASIRNPEDRELLGAYGRALADTGQYTQALDLLGKAHTPDRPDWRILNAQGAVLDRMGQHQEARRYYDTALRMAPDEPSILSNLGLSYALTKDLARAEETLRRAAADPRSDAKVKQNLGLVLALQSKFEEAERVTAGVLTPEQARANIAYFREMVREQAKRRTTDRQAGPKPG